MPKVYNADYAVPKKESCTVRSVLALGGDKFQTVAEHGCQDYRQAKRDADNMQIEHDSDGDAIRTYVYRDGDPAPLAAGLHLPKSEYRRK